jgi:glutathione synthase/RimK-type ligase-like ATP-grasp enzyme
VILVCGILADAMVELMCARLNDLGYDYFFVDELQVPDRLTISWSVSSRGVSGCIKSPTTTVDLLSVTGVYARYVSYRNDPRRPDLSDREAELVKAEHQAATMQLLEALPCVVVNRVSVSTSNDSKPFQQFMIRAVGLLTPRTLVTTVPGEAAEFYSACRKKVIFKSLSSVRSIVRPLQEQDLGRLERVRSCPTQFQEIVDGVDIRVHTVGQEVFATELVSDAADYRYAARDGVPLTARSIELPPEIASSCLQLAKGCGLAVAGIDLRRTSDGEYYCFEINPSPGFLFYERMAEQPISAAVAHLLRRGR